MAIQQIQYDDKEAINIDSAVPDKNKCKADDLNEIKSVVNNNSYETPKVSSQVDTDYKVNVLYSNNILDISKIVKGRLDSGVIGYESNTTNLTINTDSFSFTTNANYRGVTSDFIKVNGTEYLCSCTTPSTLNIIVACYDSNKNYLRDSGLTYITGHNNQAKITLQNDVAFIRIYFYLSTSGTITIEKPQLIKGFVYKDYEVFIPNTINVNNEKYTDTINVGATINDKNRVNVLYSKNLFDIKNTPIVNNTLSTSGVNLTFNDDGTIVANGTTDSTYKNIKYEFTLEAGTYYFSGCISGGSLQGYSTITDPQTTADYGSGGTFTINQKTKIGFYPIRTGSQIVTFNNAIFKPMIAKVPVTYNDYEPYITPSINVDGEEIYNAGIMNYSTNEQKIGTWIDGKPLYRKVIDFGALPNATSKTVAHNISNIDKIVKIEGITYSNQNYSPLPLVYNSSEAQYNTEIYVGSVSIAMKSTQNRSNVTAFVYLEYTKTTD